MSDLAAAKSAARAAIRHTRAQRSAAERAEVAAALTQLASQCPARSVAAYVPMRDEPGDLGVLDALAAGRRVVLPVIAGRGAPLQWGEYAGADALTDGPFGCRQPAADPALSLADVEWVIVPALAVTAAGARLGQGGGFYDRSLHGVPRERLVAVVHDDEIVATLPVDTHDVHVGAIASPAGLRRATTA
ncbi:5-formyltetrahydrofolate cyclo-ligase [Epidermidibacterium keratini]|uniref:5-formyltetrahydrofolate cyclo-ligase n=1 Tax=Epidermidibacterium keratini TaxID=1891644 RepID=A0A7L4YPG6_9ACTN|nr:5-formyltetrahydrofolate cyclo-ligase [Epidermidibacterium keratini]QHC01181.1 5-formyltetrahydrofolate cyclo-ligase [Epidermidibacterium keratini]